MVWRASPLTLRTRTRLSSFEYLNMFSLMRSRNTMGIVRSAPLTARWAPPFMLRSSFRNALTSSRAIISCRVCMGRASKTRCSLGSARILMLIILVLLLLSFSSTIVVMGAGSFLGASSSISASSFSRLSMTATHSSLAFSKADLSSSYFSTSSSTARCSSSSWASSMASSSSFSRFKRAASFSRSCSISFFLLSMLRRSIRALSAITYFLL